MKTESDTALSRPEPAPLPSSTTETTPRAAILLGATCLAPLVNGALQIATGWPLGPRMTGPVLYALLIYGGVVLSFLGGVLWGFAVLATPTASPYGAWWRYGITLMPSLVAWAGVWVGARNGLLLLAAGFAMALAYDFASADQRAMPGWHKRLRTGVILVAIASLMAAAAFGPF